MLMAHNDNDEEVTHDMMLRSARHDRVWEEVARMRCQETAVRIYRSFHAVPQMRTPADVLRMLMAMASSPSSSYPIPARRVGNVTVVAQAERNRHPGPWTSMRVLGCEPSFCWEETLGERPPITFSWSVRVGFFFCFPPPPDTSTGAAGCSTRCASAPPPRRPPRASLAPPL